MKFNEIKAARWIKGDRDRIYFNTPSLKAANVKVYAYADKNGVAKVAVKADYLVINQIVRLTIDVIKGHVEGVVDRAAGCVRSLTYAELLAEVEG